jgi:hypothetical protein
MPRHPLKVSAATRRPDVSAVASAQLSSFLCSSQESSSVASATRKGLFTRKTSRDWTPVTSTGMRETGVAPSPHRLLRASLLRSAVDVDGDIFGWDAEVGVSGEAVVRRLRRSDRPTSRPRPPPNVSVAATTQRLRRGDHPTSPARHPPGRFRRGNHPTSPHSCACHRNPAASRPRRGRVFHAKDFA